MPSWKKINLYLQKYWVREVLGKFPVMQHLRFGKLFPMSWEPSLGVERRHLEYVKAPDAEHLIHGGPLNVARSHIENGKRDEFISIHPNE